MNSSYKLLLVYFRFRFKFTPATTGRRYCFWTRHMWVCLSVGLSDKMVRCTSSKEENVPQRPPSIPPLKGQRSGSKSQKSRKCRDYFLVVTLLQIMYLLVHSVQIPAAGMLAVCLALQIFCFFYRAMLCISAVYAVMRCLSVRLSVRLSVTFVDHVKTNKHIFEIFSPAGSHTILVFPQQTRWRYSDGNPPNGGVECRSGIGRNRDSGLIAGYRRLLDVRSAKNSYRRPCSVDRTVGDAPANVCLWRPAAWTNTPKRRWYSRV